MTADSAPSINSTLITTYLSRKLDGFDAAGIVATSCAFWLLVKPPD